MQSVPMGVYERNNAMSHVHSMLAYGALKPTLNEKQRMVLDVYETGEYTDEEVANQLDWPINRISGRVGELIKMKKLEPYTDRIQNGRKVRVCRIIRN
jgi:hypothetical protein